MMEPWMILWILCLVPGAILILYALKLIKSTCDYLYYLEKKHHETD